jgi:hypothetical protein
MEEARWKMEAKTKRPSLAERTENAENTFFFIAGEGPAMKKQSAASRKLEHGNQGNKRINTQILRAHRLAPQAGVFYKTGISRFYKKLSSLCSLCLCGENAFFSASFANSSEAGEI